MPRIPRQIIPLIIIIVIVIVGFITARQIFVPASFGDLGFYRADALKEATAIEINYAGANACVECHSDIDDLKASAFHRKLSCETCHGPSAKHADAPDETLPFIPKGRDFCPVCHGYNPSRPSGFPQILPEQHNPGKACISCHNPHNPTPSHTPEECSACHRTIANQKLVSHHTSLPCTQCHNVPKEHRANPRLIRAEKPAGRETCTACHSKSAVSSLEIPRIDIETHGERRVCWDCHYPHFPEGT
ncbi:MAG: cytochrome c3 family protein [Candidatus Zixiibacteriota bacterium]